MRITATAFLFLLLFTCGAPESTTSEESEMTKTEMATTEAVDYKAMFRGYNQTDFPTRGWRVEGEDLIVEHSGTEEEGYGGDIITRETYKDFDLSLEFMLSDTSNSGILYLVREIEGTPIWHSAPEFQLLDDATYKSMPDMNIQTNQLTGANYGLHAQETDHSNPIGEWNTARIVKKGNQVTHYLNGNEMVSYELHSADWQKRYAASKFSEYPSYASVDEGHIGLQDHGHQVRFRNIVIEGL